MDPLNPPVSIVLALWAPSPSSRGLSLVEGPDGAHDVIGSVVTGRSVSSSSRYSTIASALDWILV